MARTFEGIDRVIETEVLIIGSEGAGATAAIEARRLGAKVAVVTKGSDIGKSGATVTGDADLDVDSRSLYEEFKLEGADPDDSKEVFFADMIKGGKFLNNQKLAEIHVDSAPDRLRDLISWGTKVTKVVSASGHTYRRGVFIPGPYLAPVYRRQVYKVGADVYPFTMITDLLTKGRRVTGAIGMMGASGEVVAFLAKATILATGGCMRIYPFTTAPEELTGDGFGMAYRAGAELIEMEFPMFLPGGFIWPLAVQGVDVPFILSTAGLVKGHLLNNLGDRFMTRWDPKRMEQSTRDIVSIAMRMEVERGQGSPHGGVFVSLKHLPDNLVRDLERILPKEFYMKYGGFDMKKFLPDLTKDAIEATPCSHFYNGGVRINGRCETSLPGLFAGGEVTGGVHGANRLSGNAFTEMIVWGHRSGHFAARYAKKADPPEMDRTQAGELAEKILRPLKRKAGAAPSTMSKRIQAFAWEKVGVIREGKVMEEALPDIAGMADEIEKKVATKGKSKVMNREWADALQLENMILTVEMVARASLRRKESRGALYRRDFPKMDNNKWLVNLILKKKAGKMAISPSPVVVTKIKPPKGIFDYGYVEVD